MALMFIIMLTAAGTKSGVVDVGGAGQVLLPASASCSIGHESRCSPRGYWSCHLKLMYVCVHFCIHGKVARKVPFANVSEALRANNLHSDRIVLACGVRPLLYRFRSCSNGSKTTERSIRSANLGNPRGQIVSQGVCFSE